jgi:hypothetical protein
MDVLEKPAEIQNIRDRVHQASLARMVLVQKEAEEKIKGILESKWW